MCEAESGFRYINGFVDPDTSGLLGPPVRPNISLGDSVAGLHAAFGTVPKLLLPRYLCLTHLNQVLALLKRQRQRTAGSGEDKGVTVDVSIVERYHIAS